MNFFLAEFLAVLTTTGFATGDVVARLALRHVSPFMGAFMTSVIGFLLFGSILWSVGPGVPVNLTGIGWFLLAGLIQPAFGFIVLMKAFERVGVARTAAIMGTSPLFGVSIAVLFLGERLGLSVAMGTVLIVLGVILLSLEEGTEGAMRWKAMGLSIPHGFDVRSGPGPEKIWFESHSFALIRHDRGLFFEVDQPDRLRQDVSGRPEIHQGYGCTPRPAPFMRYSFSSTFSRWNAEWSPSSSRSCSPIPC